MAVPNSDAENNRFDITGTFYDGTDDMKPDGAPHDGSPGGPNAFESEGSDANHGKPSRSGTSLPPWVG